MNIIDIILLVIAVWAFYEGIRDGLLVQIGGIAGLVIGVWLAFRQAERVGVWFGMHGAEASVAGFITVLAVTVIVIAVGSRLLRGVFRMTGLGIFDALLGAVVSLLKTAIVASLIIAAIDSVNVNNALISKERIESSRAYMPLRNFSTKIFPLFNHVREQVKVMKAAAMEKIEEQTINNEGDE
ncbi:MAG: CvpA family protein [Rikenellaceae bacterium]|nr:CvpA family protein [Rikenellaceae bacterium]